MEPSISRRLVELNHRFYQQFASEFSATRSTFQPGMLRALDAVRPFDSLLDLACGDGRVADALRGGHGGDVPASYVGLDFSTELLRQRGPWPEGFELHETDVTGAWKSHPAVAAVVEAGGFGAAVCFSALFHVPTAELRQQVVIDLGAVLRPGGKLAISVWQFLHVPELSRRVLPWSEIGLSDSDVDDGDLLMDWWRGGRGVRYVHHFAAGEVEALCRGAHLNVDDVYVSDGRTGDLGKFVLASRPL